MSQLTEMSTITVVITNYEGLILKFVILNYTHVHIFKQFADSGQLNDQLKNTQ